jgi:plastocyanin
MRRILNHNVFYVLQGVLIGVIAAVGPAYAMLQPAQEQTVDIVEFSFSPSEKTVAVGDSVIWMNLDMASHTVTAQDDNWSSLSLTQGMTYTQTFTQTGVFDYYCAIHPSMTGTIVVSPALTNQLYLPVVTKD